MKVTRVYRIVSNLRNPKKNSPISRYTLEFLLGHFNYLNIINTYKHEHIDCNPEGLHHRPIVLSSMY